MSYLWAGLCISLLMNGVLLVRLARRSQALHGLYAEQKQRKREINKAMQDEWKTNAYWQFVQVARRTLSKEMFDAILNEAKALADSYKENTDDRS